MNATSERPPAQTAAMKVRTPAAAPIPLPDSIREAMVDRDDDIEGLIDKPTEHLLHDMGRLAKEVVDRGTSQANVLLLLRRGSTQSDCADDALAMFQEYHLRTVNMVTDLAAVALALVTRSGLVEVRS